MLHLPCHRRRAKSTHHVLSLIPRFKGTRKASLLIQQKFAKTTPVNIPFLLVEINLSTSYPRDKRLQLSCC